MGAKKKGKKKGPPESGWWPGFVTKGTQNRVKFRKRKNKNVSFVNNLFSHSIQL